MPPVKKNVLGVTAQVFAVLAEVRVRLVSYIDFSMGIKLISLKIS